MQEILRRCGAFLSACRELAIKIFHIRVITLRNGMSDSPSWIRAKNGISNEVEFFLEGTWGADFCEEVAPLPGEPIVTKHRSSAFVGTDLDQLLRAARVTTVVVIGEQTREVRNRLSILEGKVGN